MSRSTPDSSIFGRYFKPYDGCQASFRGKVPQVFRSGDGPAVIVLHELGGAGPALFAFAYRIAAAGFTVYVPIIFGKANQETTRIGEFANAVRFCMGHLFTCLRSGTSSPIVQWVRDLADVVYLEHATAHAGIGVVGLCLTGNFALAMAGVAHLLAPVVSEPALPFAVAPSLRSDLGLSDAELATLSERLKDGMPIALFRFDQDPYVPIERVQRIATLVTTCGAKMFGNYRISPTRRGAHAVFTDDFDADNDASREAMNQLISFLQSRLVTSAV